MLIGILEFNLRYLTPEFCCQMLLTNVIVAMNNKSIFKAHFLSLLPKEEE
jgi:hypothetical protein